MKRNTKIFIAVSIPVAIGALIYGIKRWGSTQHKENMQTVVSKDGTKIAYEKSGNGPSIILVGGALTTHAEHAKLAKALSEDFTVYNYDRRGRGNSGDTKPYSVEREIEDIETLIEKAGGSSYLYGISSGACLALETTVALGANVKKLAIYEAPYDEGEGVVEQWKEYSSKLDQLLAADRNGEAVELHMKTVGAPTAVIIAMKVSPQWPAIKALAPTIPYDVKVVGEDRSIPVERLASIKASTLVMDGGKSRESMPFMNRSADKIARTIPNAQRRTLEGQDHNVDDKVIAAALKEFFK